MARRNGKEASWRKRRRFGEDFKHEAVPDKSKTITT